MKPSLVPLSLYAGSREVFPRAVTPTFARDVVAISFGVLIAVLAGLAAITV